MMMKCQGNKLGKVWHQIWHQRQMFVLMKCRTVSPPLSVTNWEIILSWSRNHIKSNKEACMSTLASVPTWCLQLQLVSRVNQKWSFLVSETFNGDFNNKIYTKCLYLILTCFVHGRSIIRERKGKAEGEDGRKHSKRIVYSLHPSSSLWSPQSLSPSHCHWAGMQVHSPNALTAHVKWFLPHEHSALAWTPAHGKEERARHVQVNLHIFTGIQTGKYWFLHFNNFIFPSCTHHWLKVKVLNVQAEKKKKPQPASEPWLRQHNIWQKNCTRVRQGGHLLQHTWQDCGFVFLHKASWRWFLPMWLLCFSIMIHSPCSTIPYLLNCVTKVSENHSPSV